MKIVHEIAEMSMLLKPEQRDEWRKAVNRVIDVMVASEREACARIAEIRSSMLTSRYAKDYKLACENIAAAIRARGKDAS